MSSPEDKEATLTDLRQKIVAESRFDPKHARYGLFSFTGTLAIGDDSIGKRKKPKLDSDGRVATGPRNFYTKPVKVGKTPDVYFSAPTFHSVGDPYVDPVKVLSRKSPVVMPDDVPPFKPSGSLDLCFSQFPHELGQVVAKKAFRDETGAVIIAPKNFLTSPPKKGFAGSTPHLTFSSFNATSNEPYERKWQLEHEERIRQKNLLKHDREFRTMSPGNKDFASIVETYGKTDQLQRKIPRVSQSAVLADHDHPFKPANPPKKGIMDMTLGKYPEHKSAPDVKPLPAFHPEHPWK